MPKKIISPETIEYIESLITNGNSYKEASEISGVSISSIKKHSKVKPFEPCKLEDALCKPDKNNDYAKLGNIDLKGYDLFRGLDIYNATMIENGLLPLSAKEKDVYLFCYKNRISRSMKLNSADYPNLMFDGDVLKSLQNRFLLYVGNTGRFAVFHPEQITSNFHLTGRYTAGFMKESEELYEETEVDITEE